MPIFISTCIWYICTCTCFPAIQVDDVVRTIEGTEVSVDSMSSFSDVEAIAKVHVSVRGLVCDTTVKYHE